MAGTTSSSSTTDALSVVGLSKSFGAVQALKDVTLSFRYGEVTALLGENGAGKSTLIRLCSGEHQPTTGKVAIEWQTGDKPLALRMWWREQGGPTVSEPARKGFGTTLICDVPRLKLHGKAQIDYCPEGVRWTLEADEVLSQPAASHITA